MEYNYDVFLSYRHKPLDSAVTRKAFHMLESYRLPAALRKQGFSGVRRAFRDTEELAVSRILSNTIEEALRSSNCLVLVCSPDTPSSEWVDREVATFIELGRSDRIYPLLIAGEPGISFPPSLKKIPDIENRVLDVRAAKDDPKKIIKNARVELLRVISRIGGSPAAELLRRDKMRTLRSALALRLGSAAVFALVALVCLQLWSAAVQFRKDAIEDQAASMAILKTLTYGIPDKLVELPRTYSLTAAVLEENSKQISDILALSVDKEAVMPEIAANDERCATALLKLALYDRAEELQRRAIGVYEQLAGGGLQADVFRLASALNNLGVALEATGSYDRAAEAYRDAIQTRRSYGSGDAESAASGQELAAYIGNLAVCMLRSGDAVGAEQSFMEANSMLKALAGVGYAPAQRALGTNLNNLGVLYYGQGRYDDAEEALLESVRLAQEAFDKTPNRTLLGELARSEISLATSYTRRAKFSEAISLYRSAVAAQELLAADSENFDAQSALALMYNNYGLCLNMTGDYGQASVYYMKNIEILENVFSMADTPPSQAALARACYNVAENAFKDGDYTLSKRLYDRCLDLYAPVCVVLGDYHHGEYLARLAYYQIIFERDFLTALYTASDAADLQPDSSFVFTIFGYALMYNGYTDDCDRIFAALADRSEGEVVNIRLDFEALASAGLSHPHMPAALEMMERQRGTP